MVQAKADHRLAMDSNGRVMESLTVDGHSVMDNAAKVLALKDHDHTMRRVLAEMIVAQRRKVLEGLVRNPWENHLIIHLRHFQT